MEDHKLRVFCAVAETKSFSKASELIHLTQPAVSLQIQAMEELYETRLFDRSGNTINLTPAGDILYKRAKEILALYAEAQRNISEITGAIKGSLSVGASSTIGNYLLPSIISAFKKKVPQVNISLVVSNTKTITEKLNAGEIDIALVEGDVSKQRFSVEILMSDELVVIMSPVHPWAERRNIPAIELTKEPLILREDGSGTRQVILKHLEDHGIKLDQLKLTLVMGSTEAIKGAVEEGIGVSIVSAWAARKSLKHGLLKATVFKDLKFHRNFSIISPKRNYNTHTAKEFLNFLRVYPIKSPIP
ncbi:MAG: selenium metabolism-associated LysR family transcriptional regulator [Nitrospiraceae bacterium]|nr:selenium metabolism-associated LysR family transcriptional regulator [Nitrospiraceae bacterium]